MLVPGEGMLVGSYASGLLLVHSECEESEWVTCLLVLCNHACLFCCVVVWCGVYVCVCVCVCVRSCLPSQHAALCTGRRLL